MNLYQTVKGKIALSRISWTPLLCYDAKNPQVARNPHFKEIDPWVPCRRNILSVAFLA